MALLVQTFCTRAYIGKKTKFRNYNISLNLKSKSEQYNNVYTYTHTASLVAYGASQSYYVPFFSNTIGEISLVFFPKRIGTMTINVTRD